MKKLILLVAVSFIVMSVGAQTPLVKSQTAPIPFGDQKQIRTTEFYHNNTPTRTDIQSQWYSFTTAFNDFVGGTMSYFANPLMPDSLCKRASDQSTTYIRFHSQGACFDPRSEVFEAYGNDRLLERQPYTLDSFSFRYLYEKYNDNNVKDTLVIQIFKADKISYFKWLTTPEEPWGTIAFNTKTLSANSYTEEIRYLLDYKDTATWEGGQFNWLSFALNSFDNPKGGPMAVTITFKPGYTYNLHDTLYTSKAGETVYNKKNNFWHQCYAEQASTQLTDYNNGMLMNYQVRYNQLTGNMAQLNGKYLPGSAFASSLYPYFIFKITYDKDWVDGIEEVSNNMKVGDVYPNPSSDNSNISFSLNNPEKVNIQIVNNLGQTVKNVASEVFTTGNHEVSFSTSDLTTGMYICRVSTEGGIISKTFLVE